MEFIEKYKSNRKIEKQEFVRYIDERQIDMMREE